VIIQLPRGTADDQFSDELATPVETGDGG